MATRPPRTGTAFCAMCWGQGRIYEPTDDEASDLLPVVCEACCGTGRADAPHAGSAEER